MNFADKNIYISDVWGQGYRFLSLATGAANDRALGFYRRIGFQKENVTLVKLL